MTVYFQHPFNLRQQTNAQVMIAECPNGLALYGLWIIILETLGINEGKIMLDDMGVRSLAIVTGIKRGEIRQYCEQLAEYRLITIEDDGITSDTYTAFLNALVMTAERKSEIARQNVKKRWDKAKHKPIDVEA